MNIKKLVLILIPFLLAGCSDGNQSNQYQAINDQQSVMKDYYRRHNSNLSNLSKYTYERKYSYNPTYDVFGELAPSITVSGLYFESTNKSEIGVYSGYFIKNSTTKNYIGNKKDVGSIRTVQRGQSYWFRSFDEEGHKNELQLIYRTEIKENDLANEIVDHKMNVAVATNDVSHYFSNNINTDYKDLFDYPLEQPTATTTREVLAFSKSETEIIEQTIEVVEYGSITNPLQPGEENKIAIMESTTSTTTFKKIENIGWAGTDYTMKSTIALVTDYDFKLLDEPRVVITDEINVTFAYSTSVVPYSGDAYVYQAEDLNVEKYRPSLYKYENGAYVKMELEPNDVSSEYKTLHPEFSGYAYSFNSVEIKKSELYAFSTYQDILNGNYESVGYKELVKNAGGTLVFGGLESHNFFTTITASQKYEFIILVSSSGTKSLIGHFTK